MVAHQPEEHDTIEDVAGSVASGTDGNFFTRADFEDALSKVFPVVGESTSSPESTETSE